MSQGHTESSRVVPEDLGVVSGNYKEYQEFSGGIRNASKGLKGVAGSLMGAYGGPKRVSGDPKGLPEDPKFF